MSAVQSKVSVMKIRTKRQKWCLKGVTLVEILIVATIFSIVGVSIASSFFCGMKLWKRAQYTDFMHTDTLLTLEIIARELQQSVNISSIEFEGDSQKVSFPMLVGNSIVRITYEFNASSNVLVRRQVSLDDIIAKKEDVSYTEKEILTAENIYLEYLYFDSEKEEFVWKDVWQKDMGKIVAIKLEIKVKENEYTKTVFTPEA